MTVTFLPLLLFIVGLIYLRAKTNTPIFGLIAGLVCFYITTEFAPTESVLFTFIFASLGLFLVVWTVRDTLQ